MHKQYGLTGETVNLRHKAGETTACPWGYAEQKVRITEEYPCLLVAVLLPHRHPHGFRDSRPYRICINKVDIMLGEMIINGGAIR
jgi:hypothetical protein